MAKIYVTEPGTTGGVGATGMRVLVQSLRDAGHDVTRVKLFRSVDAGADAQMDMFGRETEAVADAAWLAKPDAWFVSTLYARQYLEMGAMFAKLGLAPMSADRSPSDPLVAFGGQFSYAPEPIADFADVIAAGDGELTGARIASMLDAKATRGDVMRELDGEPGFYVPSRGVSRLSRLEADTYSAITIEDARNPTIELARGCKSKCAFCRIGWAGGTYREAPREQVEAAIRSVGKGRPVNIFAPDYSSVSWVDDVEGLVSEVGCRNTSRDARADATHRMLARVEGVKQYSFGVEGLSERIRAGIGKPLTAERLVSTMETLASRGVSVVKWYLILGFPGETDADRDEFVALLEATRKVYHGTLQVTPTLLQPCPHTPMERLSARFDVAAHARAESLRAWARDAHERDGRKWIVAQPKGPELHESDSALTRAGRDASRYLATAKLSDVASGRWRAHLPDALLDSIPDDAPTAWDHVDGPTSAQKRLGMERYRKALARLRVL